MTQGFDDWYSTNSWDIENYYDAENGYKAGAASRQAEIGALSTLNEMSEQKIDDLVLRNIELQKRIDGFIRLHKGYKLVPIEPTEEMIMKSYNDYGDYVGDGLPKDIYKAMIGACDE